MPTILDIDGNPWEVPAEQTKKCECGSASAGSPKHSSYCPVYKPDSDQESDRNHRWGTFDNTRGCFACDLCGYEAFPDQNGVFAFVPDCPGAKP